MATTGSRGPIKVGSGYIDVFPKINQKQLRETRAQLEKQMGATGKKAGKAFSDGVTSQVAQIPKKAKAAADKAQKEIQKSALDSKKVLKRIEQEITKEYGKEAGKRFREAAELEKKKKKLLESTSAETRRAIRQTTQEEEKAARTRARANEVAEKERLRLLRQRERAEEQARRDEARRWEAGQREYQRFMADRTREAQRAARAEAAAFRQSQREQRAELRQTLTEMRQARLADLRSQLDTHRSQAGELRRQLLDYRRQMQDHTRSVGRSLTGLQTSWRRQGEAIERLGTNITETGRLVGTALLAPLGAVSAMLTTIGVKSADMRILGQMGLSAAGVDKKQSAAQMNAIQQYAIATPFSIDTMHEYQMKLIRSIAGNDDEWYNKKTKTKAANKAASKTTDIIMAVGDSMAQAGNLDPNMFARAMYAIDRIMDLDKAPTRNINQLVQATGIPAGELAHMFGYENAGAFWKQVGTPVAKGGGISGRDMVDNLLQHWDPAYFELDKNGKRKIDPKSGLPVVNPDSSRTGGSAGYGEKMTSATISGRISQMKEQAQFNLGSLFAQEDPKTGEYKYTKLGEAIMGKRVPVMKRDKMGELTETGEYTYEGGLLQQVQELMSGQKGNVIKLLQTSFEALGTFVEQIQSFSDWLDQHPEIKDGLAEVAKLAIAVAPFVLALGLATKVLGKVTKIFGAAMAPVAGLARGARGATRGLRQVGSSAREGIRSVRNGDDIGTTRDRMSQRYRDRRTDLRGGDTRGPVARARDRITGNDSGRNQLAQQIRDTEDAIRQTEGSMRDLQRQIRDVNSTSISQLVNQFMGSTGSSGGNGSLGGAAQNAGNQINQVNPQVNQLNQQSLSGLSGEFTTVIDKAKDLTSKVNKSSEAVVSLNGKKLVELKVTVDGAHGSVTDLKNEITDTSSSVGALNRRKLDSLRTEFDQSTSTAQTLKERVEQVISAVTRLNAKKLSTLREQFTSLKNAVNDVHKLVGTNNSGLTGRVENLNKRPLKKVTDAVKGLKTALKEAGDKADTLLGHLEDIGNISPGAGGSGGSSSGGKKKGKKATGGVLTGYTPGRDVHRFYSPTGGQLDLSGGEAVMRPEWTAAVGPQYVNQMNAVARAQGASGIRRVMATQRFASGGIIESLGLDRLIQLSKSFNVGNDVAAAGATMAMDSSSRGIGGGAQKGVIRTGTHAAGVVGSDLSGKFKGIYDFITDGSWKLLKKLPTGLGQAVGLVGGALAPTAGDLFWDDVWKGNGNILERGGRFVKHLFSPSSIKDIIGDFFGGILDSGKSIWDMGKAIVTDPIGTVKDAFNGVWDLVTSEYDSVTGMVSGIREIWKSPKDYAAQVIKDTYATAKEALPNLDGLFDFSGSKLDVKRPDIGNQAEITLGTPGVGDAVSRWTPQVKMVLGQLGLPMSDLPLVLHRIQVESGGNPKAINNWDINAKNGYPSQGLMQTIPQTFNAYAGPYRSRGITDPLASIYAGLNYATHRYGSKWRQALSGVKGYWTGTLSASPGLALVGERGPELVDFGRGGQRVYDNRETQSLMSREPVSITVNEAKHETTPDAVIRGLQWYDSMYGNKL
ncbi:tape measure protein [Streptomyces phage Ibantik]|uniref:Tape measure protein n=1 Tax=Streptomyces phage Ibantik TaxID=2182397 RepID=A0A2U8UP99_9CAUD|nr:tape measure protein [Streptomyces phage Ibantik]AWN05301.1 tape measure protein [Streptomyces phage Ibantik]